jgi:hypothetical protein
MTRVSKLANYRKCIFRNHVVPKNHQALVYTYLPTLRQSFGSPFFLTKAGSEYIWIYSYHIHIQQPGYEYDMLRI